MHSALRLKTQRSLIDEVAPLSVFMLISLLVVFIAPHFKDTFNSSLQTGAVQSIATSLSLVVVTGVLLYYFRQTIRLSWAWYTLALIYNCAIIAIKFIVSPAYLHNSLGRASAKYLLTGLVVMFLYLLTFWLLYIIYKRRFQKNRQKAATNY